MLHGDKTWFKAGHESTSPQGEKNGGWKGDEVGYSGLHHWVRRKLGNPQVCGNCGTENAKRYEWAIIDHSYTRDLTTWVRVCNSCHLKMDRNYNG